MAQPGELSAALQRRDHGLIALLRRVAQGDQAALDALYGETSALVYGLAVRILRDQSAAEEVSIDVYAQVYRQAANYDPARGSPLAWLLTLARSRAIDRLRAESRTRQLERPLQTAPAIPSPTDDPEICTALTELRRTIQHALAALAPEQREAIGMAYYSGLSQSEIAAKLGQPLGTIKSRIRSGMILLRDRLRPFHEAGYP